MKSILLTDRELREMKQALDSMNELVYDKVIYEEKKDAKKHNRRLSQVR